MISNAPVRLREILEREDLIPLVDTIVISSEVGVEKPDKEIFVIALEEAGIAPKEAIYVGDSLYSDVMGAENAGMIPVLLDRKGRHSDTKYQRIQSLLELQKLLDC
ncbi:MAG: HAD-IA family hydrolase [Candidatus Cloacimonetes bacterium]|nr:HAD-IA family hydrolase [Candidatus Cloacimonadota bacterium]